MPYVRLVPNYGPFTGNTKIRLENLGINQTMFTVRIFLGQHLCPIVRDNQQDDYTIECIHRTCTNASERLLLNVTVDHRQWQLMPTYFQCRENPIVTTWHPTTITIR
jgi:hypothetical protein